jgi:hypothetical protein
MASGLNELKNVFLIVSWLTLVTKYGRKNSHPFAVELGAMEALMMSRRDLICDFYCPMPSIQVEIQ